MSALKGRLRQGVLVRYRSCPFCFGYLISDYMLFFHIIILISLEYLIFLEEGDVMGLKF